jgi:hypothetical protein
MLVLTRDQLVMGGPRRVIALQSMPATSPVIPSACATSLLKAPRGVIQPKIPSA